MAITKSKSMMTVHKLTKIAERFLKEEYNLKLTIPIKFNNRLTTTLGRFIIDRNTFKAKVIEINTKMLANYTEEEIIDVLKHELVHYACFKMNKPFDDGDPFFENELKRLGVNSTNAYKYRGKVHMYGCKKCKRVMAETVRKTKKYEKFMTACCHADIVYFGIKYV